MFSIVTLYVGQRKAFLLNEYLRMSPIYVTLSRGFFLTYVLPELLSHKLYRRLTSGNDSNNLKTSTSRKPENTSIADDEQFCICRRGEFGNMIACDNPLCKIEWFHYSCVGLKRKPVGTALLVNFCLKKEKLSNEFICSINNFVIV